MGCTNRDGVKSSNFQSTNLTEIINVQAAESILIFWRMQKELPREIPVSRGGGGGGQWFKKKTFQFFIRYDGKWYDIS